VKVRLRKPATLVTEVGHHWHGAGDEVDIPEDHFDAELHEAIVPDAFAAGPQPLEDDEPDEDGKPKPRKRK